MTNKECNVPGCEEPVGEQTVWCEKHYEERKNAE